MKPIFMQIDNPMQIILKSGIQLFLLRPGVLIPGTLYRVLVTKVSEKVNQDLEHSRPDL